MLPASHEQYAFAAKPVDYHRWKREAERALIEGDPDDPDEAERFRALAKAENNDPLSVGEPCGEGRVAPAGYAYSADGTNFIGRYKSRSQAASAAAAELPVGARFWTGRAIPPTCPEGYWQASDWLEHVSVQEDYESDAADGWDRSTSGQREELNGRVQTVLANWLDEHGLRPKFSAIEDTEEHTVSGDRKWGGVS